MKTSDFAGRFRVYDKEKERMHEPANNFLISGNGILYNLEKDEVAGSRYEVMWCLEVTDNNNQLVYEGDIVKRIEDYNEDEIDDDITLPDYGGALGVVLYKASELCTSFRIEQKTGHKRAFYSPDGINFSWAREIEVIGNIFQTKELLMEDA